MPVMGCSMTAKKGLVKTLSMPFNFDKGHSNCFLAAMADGMAGFAFIHYAKDQPITSSIIPCEKPN